MTKDDFQTMDPLAALPPFVREKLAQRAALRPIVRKRDCGRCIDHRSDLAMACSFRGSDEPEQGAPMCRHVAAVAAEEREVEITRVRRERLERAGCRHPRALSIIPPARGIPYPPEDLFPDRETMRGAMTAVDAARDFLADPDTLALVLIGSTGSGKSMPAAGIVASSSAPSVWIDARYARSPSWWFGTDHEVGIRDRAFRARIVVIDELGTETEGSDRWSASVELGVLMEDCLNTDRKLVVTLNVPDGQTHVDVLSRYGGAFLSRLREFGRVVSAGSYDMRERAGKLRGRAA